jgi:23S rRNA pseudouridine955/2504/2580 synthase
MVDILYEDDRLLILNKPPGIAVHMSAEDGDRNLVNLAERFMMWRGTVVKLRPVNRLDKGTSGAVLLAKSSSSAGMFGRFVKEEGLGKVYLAVVAGKPADSGEINIALDGKESETAYRLLAGTEECSLAVVFPRTGRMHQIRKHFSLIGHPIMGDRRYGGPPLTGCPGFGLHALSVSLHHQELGRELSVMAPLPDSLIRIFNQLDLTGEAFTSLPTLPPGKE